MKDCSEIIISAVNLKLLTGARLGLKIKVEVETIQTNGGTDRFDMNITITRAREERVEILDQKKEHPERSKFIEDLKNKQFLSARYFRGWVSPNPKLKVQLTFY